MIFQHGRRVVRVGHDILGIEFARLEDEETDLFWRDRQIRRVVAVFIGHGEPQAEQANWSNCAAGGSGQPVPAKSIDGEDSSRSEGQKINLACRSRKSS